MILMDSEWLYTARTRQYIKNELSGIDTAAKHVAIMMIAVQLSNFLARRKIKWNQYDNS